MITEKKTRNISETTIKHIKGKQEKVIMEIQSANDLKRFVIPYQEWLLIEKWYCTAGDTEDYLLKLGDGSESFRIIRLNKQISEIRVLKLNRALITSKNLSRILFTKVPSAIKFIVPFCMVLALWAVMGIISLVKQTEVDIVTSGVKLTSLAFVLFLLLNAQFAVVKIVDAVKNKYEAFVFENDEHLTDTLLFNMGLIFLFVIVGAGNIIKLIESFLNYINLVP